MLSKNDAGPMLINLLLIVVGVAVAVWLSTLSQRDLNRVADLSLNWIAILLAQPGVFLAAKIATHNQLTWKRRIAYGGAVFLLLGWAFPAALSAWLSQYVQF